MNPIDLAIIVVYVVGCTSLGAWLGTRGQGLKGYFLGESNIPAWAVMISIVATETSTATFLSVPGVAYRGDFSFLQLALGYILGRVVVATLLLPSYFRGEIFTAYQVLERRFGGATRTTASLLFLATRTLADGLRLFLAAKVLEQITGWPIGGAILAMGLTTIVYTYLGGMKAVIWTDVIQFTIYITGALIALAILVRMLPGGMDELLMRAREGHKFHMFNFTFSLQEPFTFWAGLLGGMVLNTATHGADQMMVQRYLSARSRAQATAALIASGFVILAQFALFLFIGVSLWVFYQDYIPRLDSGVALAPDEVFAYFIVHYLPMGILGLVVAAIFSAAMGTLSGSLNASASTTVNDLYRPLFPATDERRLLQLSRALTAAWGVLQMTVALGATRLEGSVVTNALKIASFTTGLVLGLFLLGIVTTRVGQTAAFAGLLAGLAAVSTVAFTGLVAWPWYALVGSFTVFAVGNAAAWVLPAANPLATPGHLQTDTSA
jgi:SSS family transporter